MTESPPPEDPDSSDRLAAITTLAALRGITVPDIASTGAYDADTPAGYVLPSADIGTKYGFSDGNCPAPVADMVKDWFNDDWVFISSDVWHPVLFDVVTTRLLPAVGAPDLPVYLMSTIHNPIRLSDATYQVPAGTVTVDWMDLFARVVAAMPQRHILSDADRAADG